MNNYQQNQIEVINQIESQIKNKTLNFSTVAPINNYATDPRVSLTSVHFPDSKLLKKIQNELIEPLREVFPSAFFYPRNSLHMTIKNIRVINNPMHFTPTVVESVKKVFSEVLKTHSKLNVYFYRLLIFPNNLALIGTSDEELDDIILDLDKRLNEIGQPDDKQYINNKYFFSNMTLA